MPQFSIRWIHEANVEVYLIFMECIVNNAAHIPVLEERH